MDDDNIFEDAAMPDAGDMKEITIYKAFRKWRAAQKRLTIPEAYRAGYAQAEMICAGCKRNIAHMLAVIERENAYYCSAECESSTKRGADSQI